MNKSPLKSGGLAKSKLDKKSIEQKIIHLAIHENHAPRKLQSLVITGFKEFYYNINSKR